MKCESVVAFPVPDFIGLELCVCEMARLYIHVFVRPKEALRSHRALIQERFPASAQGRVLLQQPFKYINGVIVDERIRNVVSKIEYVTARVRECASHVRRNAKCFRSASSTRMLSSKTD
ncbi:hypothetical protein NDU88_002929 [Pleurodeles waltl]|uniref:Uncharacterized protein n=1 Tax=Pleurodeles waltl TaxID=8319 RepID=A0AAV7W206_PLEWA|nr:hypothetical protein NDU88_002929 [Pleurodeles waltl]